MAEPDYEALRRQLIERGYLEGRIARFMLQDLAPGRGALARRLFPPLRAALIGGPVLGALLAAVVASSNRPAFGAGDLPLLWIYFCIPSIAALFVVEALVAAGMTGLAAWRGVRPGDAFRAGLLVAMPLVLYVAWLWWAGGRQERRLAPWDLAVALLAVAAVLLASWLAGLVSLASIVGRTGQIPARHRRGVRLLVVSLAGLGLAVWLVRTVAAPDDPATTPPLDLPRSGPSVLLIGVDGLGSDLLQALEPRGVAEPLLDRMARSAVFPLARGGEAGAPPRTWTTLMTGEPPERHGVTTIEREALPGLRVPIGGSRESVALDAALRYLLPSRTVPTSGAVRQVRALWEIAALSRPVAAVGWWASWPAVLEGPADGGPAGYVVSDRVLAKLLAGAPPDRDTYPTTLFERLAGDFSADRSALRAAFAEAVPSTGDRSLDAWLWESFLIDGYALGVLDRLTEDPAVGARFVYLPGLDILRVRLAGRGGPGAGDLVAEARQQQGLERYAAWLARSLAERWDRGIASGTVVLVGDPGREASPAEEGFVVVGGDGARAACVGPVLTPLDVVPLALERLGLPASLEMTGRAPEACLSPVGRPGPIEGYGRPRSLREAAESAYDPEMMERLKSLGYVD